MVVHLLSLSFPLLWGSPELASTVKVKTSPSSESAANVFSQHVILVIVGRFMDCGGRYGITSDGKACMGKL
jgi:hypothetical protein